MLLRVPQDNLFQGMKRRFKHVARVSLLIVLSQCPLLAGRKVFFRNTHNFECPRNVIYRVFMTTITEERIKKFKWLFYKLSAVSRGLQYSVMTTRADRS